MATRLLFVSDVHLYPGDDARADLFFSFLNEQRAATEAVYILGDLFDYWVGAKQVRLPAWARYLERLGEVARDGPSIGVLGGNRDYLLDEASLSPFGLESLGREHSFECDGLRFTLVHGDRQYPDSVHSRAFLRLIHSRPACFAARSVPLRASTAVARCMRRYRRWASRTWDPESAARYEPARFLPLFDAGADVVVCGHNHWAKDYSGELGRPGCRLFALGEWAERPSYLEYAGGQFRLVDPRLEV